ncbi:GIY-YIG nuclease family protein [Emticicia sp. W12TSBA100-4]|uniref:GIY-YIG nuclease family protein n=1 Tax=Emticicia sp. W12TSBA100-4 TaxID=3160965 RepID=UPI0033060501
MELEEILQIINSDEFINVEENWQNIDLTKLEEKRKTSDLKKSGVYALYNENYGFIYVGKAKKIYDRLKSHNEATKGNEKADCWREFFMAITGNIVGYWYPLESKNNAQKEESARQILERLIQIKYEPIFDKIYPRGKRVSRPDINEVLERYRKKRKMNE